MIDWGKWETPYTDADLFHQATGYAIGARGLLHRQGRVLLVLHNNDRKWRLPGGTVDHRETPVDAVQRWVERSLQVDVEAAGFLGVTHHPGEAYLQLIFEMHAVNGAFRIQPDGRRVLHAVWFRTGALPENISPCTRSAIDACSGLKPVPFLVTHHSSESCVWQP